VPAPAPAPPRRKAATVNSPFSRHRESAVMAGVCGGPLSPSDDLGWHGLRLFVALRPFFLSRSRAAPVNMPALAVSGLDRCLYTTVFLQCWAPFVSRSNLGSSCRRHLDRPSRHRKAVLLLGTVPKKGCHSNEERLYVQPHPLYPKRANSGSIAS